MTARIPPQSAELRFDHGERTSVGHILNFRRCYQRPSVFHAAANLRCDCLRTEIPVEARAKSSGALATPFRASGGGR